MTSSKPAKYFILGSQRSGTTLLGLCLEVHPDVELVEEADTRFHQPYFFTKRIDLRCVNNYKPDKKRVICFKSPRDSHRVKAIRDEVDSAKILWMRRSVYEVVASMLRPRANVGGTSWASKHAEHELIKYLFEGVYDPVLAKSCRQAASLKSSREKMVKLACLCWIAKARCGLLAREYFKHDCYQVDYSQLVVNPKEVMSNLMLFLDLPWNDRVLRHGEFISGSRPGGTSPNRAIDSMSLEKWRSELLEGDLDAIDRLLSQYPEVDIT